MSSKKKFETDIIIGGKVDPSMYKSFKKAKNEMNATEKSSGTVANKITSHFSKMGGTTGKIFSSLSKESVAGVGAAGAAALLAVGAAEFAIYKKLYSVAKEFGKESVAAWEESLTN